jgi:hypothetical protein
MKQKVNWPLVATIVQIAYYLLACSNELITLVNSLAGYTWWF